MQGEQEASTASERMQREKAMALAMEDTAMERLSKRVVGVGMLGAVVGGASATLKGFPLGRTSMLTAMSCSMAGVALFGTERLGYLVLQDIDSIAQRQKLLISHTFAGLSGGSLLGTIYQNRPLNGMALCVPLMVLVGFGEYRLEKFLERKTQEHWELVEQQQQEDAKSGS